jgi:5,10-methylene-tetrahydrofolate dehydrogenase/methenyl tetrahydrofolate cyclohydrolase
MSKQLAFSVFLCLHVRSCLEFHNSSLSSVSLLLSLHLQLPLPSHIHESTVLERISLEKDADGLHPMNAGLLALKGKAPKAVACTPKGCIELLKRYKIPIEGKKAVVLGRSNIVGIPASLLLLHENATVTVCHSRTQNIASVIGEADILVAAIGKANFVKGEWLKQGAVVIDVGINSVPDATKTQGSRLVGDVDYESAVASGKVSAITPVPGGVGPMTIAMLLSNTVDAYERHVSSTSDGATAASGGGSS